MFDLFIQLPTDVSPDSFDALRSGVPKLSQSASARIVWVGDSGSLEKISYFAELNQFECVDAETILPASTRNAPLPARFDAIARQRLYRDLLAAELRIISKSRRFIVWNALDPIEKSLELFRDGRLVCRRENQFSFPRAMMFNWLFGMIPTPSLAFCESPRVLDRAILESMAAKIQARFNQPWWNVVLGILNQVPRTDFSLMQVFGDYMAMHHANAFVSDETSQKESNRSIPAPGFVRMSTLGHNGRFANQVFQYAYLRKYARDRDLDAQTPPWIGCGLFGHSATLDESTSAPILIEPFADTETSLRFDASKSPRDFDLWGFFQDARMWSNDKELFRSLFKPLPNIQSVLDQSIARLRDGDRTLVSIHIRRGDYTGGPVFWPAPESWYLKWLDELWPTLHRPLLHIATDDPNNVLPHFTRFSPVTDRDLNVTLKGAEFYADFYTLTQCDVLAISNSSYSYAAAMLNERAKLFARPMPASASIESFDPWTSDVLLKWQSPLHRAA